MLTLTKIDPHSREMTQAKEKWPPLRQLRAVTGLSRAQFARRAGCSLKLIESIELGTRKLTDKLALQISLFTDVDIRSITDKRSTGPRRGGNPYTAETWKDSQARHKLPVKEDEFYLIDRSITTPIEFYLKAALERKCIRQFATMVRSQLWGITKDFGLGPTVERLMDEEKERIGYNKFVKGKYADQLEEEITSGPLTKDGFGVLTVFKRKDKSSKTRRKQ